jgi:glucose-6-phosphate isomerase
VDFLAPLRSQTPLADMHELLLANCFAQSEALMRGKNDAEVRAELAAAGLDEQQIAFLLPHKLFPGNRPSSTVLYEQLTPASLGALIAMYEHKVFTAGVLWGINSFDQWGVELGKQLANSIVKNLRGEAPVSTERDSSTRGLIEYWRTRAGRT